MRQVRYLLLLLALLIGVTTQAQYNPTNPDEPGAKPWQLTLKAIPAEAGYFSLNQQTSHAEGEQMRLQAYNHNNYQFIRWEDEKGNILSTNSSLDYTMPSANITLVARYEYTPGPPSEPGQASIKRRLMLKTNPEGAGRFNLNSSSDISTGEVVNLRAYNNKNYYFRNWTQDGAIISTSANFAYTMPSQDVTLVANFDYDYQPDSPNEPGQPTNTYYNIYGVRMEAKVGQTISYPLYLENRGAAVTGFQVDVSIPKGFTTDAKDITLTDRAIGHTLKVEQTTEGTWRINVSGAKVFEDESGQMLILPIHVPDTATIGQVFNISLANGIVVKEGGEQQNVNVRNGSLKILSSDDTQPNSPDYIVADIRTTTSNVMPGGNLFLSWQVKNQGNIAGLGSWTERIYLIGTDGRKVSIGTASFDAKELQPGASVSRSATMTLAQLPGIDGKVDVAITIVPNSNSGEVSNLSTNNTAQTDAQPITVGKRLLLTLPNKPQLEGEVTNIRCQLARSGNWSQAETFMLTKIKGDNRILTPETVVVPREQASVYFYLTLANDDLCNTDSVVSLRIEGNGYDAVEGSFIVTDNELMPLRLTASSTEVSEGDTFQLTVTLAQPSEKPLTVSLTSELPKRFRLPASLVIPAGQTIGTVDVTAIDNEIPDGDVSCAFTAYAAGFEPAEAIVILNDNDLPVLELTFTPNKVKENDGPVCITGTLRRLTNIDKKITVRLSDDSDGGLYFSQKELTLAKGVQQATFSLGPVGNSTVDGDRQYTVTAAVWLSSCSCSASGQAAGNVQAQIEVFDDDGPALSLTSSQATVREGVTTRITVTRNTSTEKALTVRLSSDHDDLLTYNHTLVIPAGQQSAYVEVTPAANDSQTIVFTAESEGFSSGTCYVLVTDQTLPDAVISSIVVNKTEIEAGNDVLVSLIVTNTGISVLPAGIEVSLYADTYQRTIKTHKPLEVGESTELKADLSMPLTIGRAKCYAIINERLIEHELSYNNNTSQIIFVSTVAPYKAALSTNKSIYCQGENVIINGSLTGQIDTEQTVEVYFIHEGNRFAQNTTTDKDGNFKLNWEPFQGMYGKVSIGACYEGEKSNKEMASVNIVGLKLSDNEPLLLQPIVGEKHKGEIEIKNPVALKQTEISVETITKPSNIDVSFDIENNINSEGTALLKYTITPLSATQGTNWQKVELKVTSNEGASLDITIRVYARNAVATLLPSESKIKTTVTKGVISNYSLTLTNIGNGETGIVALSLPEWIRCAMGNTLPSIPKNGVMDIMLLINPTEEMSLNKPRKGTIGINCQNGNGIGVDYEITPVESAIGTLIVDAVDTYTYNTPEAPHVSDAKVDLLMPISKEIVATGITDEDGLYKVDLPAGYYQLEITTLKHDKYAREVYVAPSTDNNVLAILQYEPITMSWSVSETEVEDEYAIVNSIEYETNVPMPVIILDVPDRIEADQLAEGESLIFNAIITNKGLIAGKNTSLLLSEHPLFTIETLAKDRELTIAPQQSIVIPVKVTRRTLSQNHGKRSITIAGIEVDCGIRTETLSYYDCGEDGQMYLCQKSIMFFGCDITDHNKYTIPTFPRVPEIVDPPFIGEVSVAPGIEIIDPPVLIYKGCEPCQNTKLLKIAEFGTSWLPYLSAPAGAASCLGEHYVDGKRDARHYVNCSNTLLNSGKRIIPKVWKGSEKVVKKFWILNILNFLYQYREPCNLGKNINEGKRRTSEISYLTAFEEKLRIPINELEAYRDYLMELFGNESLAEEADYDSQQSLLDGIISSTKEYYQTGELQPYKPNNVSDELFSEFIERLNNTTHIANGEQVEGNNYIHQDVISECVRRINQAEQEAVQLGYLSTEDMLTKEFELVYDKLQEQSNSICASVTLKFSQTMNLTRPAYRGTLEVFNGHDEIPMQDVKLNLVVRDESGKVSTAHEFQINAESLDGFEGEIDMTSGWTLDAQKTGTVTVLFIPTKYAAPTEPMEYSFGGMLTYLDPFTGLEVTRDLYPVTLTVNPSPDLELTYLMQRDVYGDDPLTEEVVEPKEPAEFALIINNKGNGEAKNMRMLTEQPKIVDNEKGLLIDFQLVSSQVNGEPATLSFGKTIANNFGTIPGHSQAYGQWWLESSLLGHFTSYEVEATHVTSYGNQNLSLIDTVTIHEMIHGFTDAMLLSSKPRRGYLVNDIVDADDLPDVIYFTDASQQPLYISTGNIDRLANSEYMLTATTKQQGWNYGSIADPTGGKLKLASITRSRDGAELPIDNMWQTSRTLRDAREWLYENRLHYVVWLPESGESYLLKFTDGDIVGIGTVETDGEQKGNIHLRMSGGWLTITGDFHELRSIELFDLRGVKQRTTAHQQQGQTVNISSLPSGVYFVRVNTDQGTCHAKVLKK